MAKSRPRLQRFRKLERKLIGVVLSEAYRRYQGHRVARIVRALYDPQKKIIVRLQIRMFGGAATPHGGFNGRQFTLRDRRLFAMKDSLSVGIIRGKKIVPIDQYVTLALKNMSVTDEKPAKKATKLSSFCDTDYSGF